MDAGGHTEEDQRLLLLTCKVVWAPRSKILQSTSSCWSWNSSSQFTTCTMLQQLLWPLACSRAQGELNHIAWQKGRTLGNQEAGSAMGSLTGHCRTASCSSAKDRSVPSVTERWRDTQWDMGFSIPHHQAALGSN